jgi:mRNA interferase YafQ
VERLVREIFEQTRFRKDLKKVKRAGRYDVNDLLAVVTTLAADKPLSPKRRDHSLTGEWVDFRECHIKPDWLLIYRLEPGKLILVRTGSHSELFD